MRIAIGISVLVLIVAGLHLVAGWVFSTGFRSQALRIQHGQRKWGFYAQAVDRTSITLTASEPKQELGHPGTLGLHWEGGYGQAGEVIDIDGLAVRRAYKHIQGDPPPVCRADTLDECEEIDIESYAFPNDPGDVGLKFSEITYKSELGPMGAWVVPTRSPEKWAIHVHGWTAERREAIRVLPVFATSGVNSLVIDYRNDLGAPEDPSGHYRFGLSEWADVEAAVRWTISEGATTIVLVGYSTGAAHIMSFLKQSDLASRASAIIFDAPNILLAETVRDGSRGLRLEPTSLPITRLMLEFGMWIADLRWKIDWDQTNYVQRAENILNVPTLVFHGTSDHRVPISVSRQLEARVPDYVTLVEVPAAGHVMSWNANPNAYETCVTRFLETL